MVQSFTSKSAINSVDVMRTVVLMWSFSFVKCQELPTTQFIACDGTIGRASMKCMPCIT